MNHHRHGCAEVWASPAELAAQHEGHRCARPLHHPPPHMCACSAKRWGPGE